MLARCRLLVGRCSVRLGVLRRFSLCTRHRVCHDETGRWPCFDCSSTCNLFGWRPRASHAAHAIPGCCCLPQHEATSSPLQLPCLVHELVTCVIVIVLAGHDGVAPCLPLRGQLQTHASCCDPIATRMFVQRSGFSCWCASTQGPLTSTACMRRLTAKSTFTIQTSCANPLEETFREWPNQCVREYAKRPSSAMGIDGMPSKRIAHAATTCREGRGTRGGAAT